MKGCDSAYGPSFESAQAAKADGVVWWEVYVGGPNATHTWTAAEAVVLQRLGIVPVAIWVPSYGLDEDPIQAAADAVGAMEDRGMWGALMLDTEERMKDSPHLRPFVDAWCAHVPRPSVYAGAGYVPNHAEPVWLDWGGTSLPLGGHAVQYGPAQAYGMSIDRDLADGDFPLGSWSKPTPTAAEATAASHVPSNSGLSSRPASSPQPAVLEDAMKTYLAICSEKFNPAAGEPYPHVAEGRVWIIAGASRSYVATEADVTGLLEEFGQDHPRRLSGATLARIPVAPVVP